MPRVSPVAPSIAINLDRIKDHELRAQIDGIFRQLTHILSGIRRDVALVDHQYVSQNAQPTPEEGELLVWKDADAGAGQPEAYLVTKQNGVVYTFASVETV
jgi:hypothetical protein